MGMPGVPATDTDAHTPDPPSLAVIVLAAGAGTRMHSALPKPLHPLGGRPLVMHPLRAAAALHARSMVVVVGHQADVVRHALGEGYCYAEQAPQRGTAHAVEVALPHILEDVDVIFVLF